MFGTQRDFDKRIAEYRNSLAGIKHLHRLKKSLAAASRPQPNQPITLHVTTSGGIAYDSVRCWMNANGEETTLEFASGESEWSTLEWRYVRHWHGQIPPQANGTIVRYKIGGRVVGSDRWIFADNQARVLSEATEFAVLGRRLRCTNVGTRCRYLPHLLRSVLSRRRCAVEETDKPLRVFRWHTPRCNSEARLYSIARMQRDLALTALCKSIAPRLRCDRLLHR